MIDVYYFIHVITKGDNSVMDCTEIWITWKPIDVHVFNVFLKRLFETNYDKTELKNFLYSEALTVCFLSDYQQWLKEFI